MHRKWHIAEPIEASSALRSAVGGHPLVAQLLAQRGFIDPKDAESLLDPGCYRPADPFALPHMPTAVDLLKHAARAGKRARVWGDFDADGQTATALLVEALSCVQIPVDYDLPRRNEGHGFSRRAVDEALHDGIELLLTCDTGITDAETVRYGIDHGLTVIVTDHHDLPTQLPPADAVIDPKMLPCDHPLGELTGVGVAYMLALALLSDNACEQALERMLDLVAVGMIADVARLVDDARYLVQRGLAVLQRSSRPGLMALAEAAELDLIAADDKAVGFQIAPRLNAAGRLADARLVVEMLLTMDHHRAQELAGSLEALNRDRRAKTEALQRQCEERLNRDPELLRQPAVMLDGNGWEPGVLGLVAGNLARLHNRPAILVAHRAGEASVASARSIEGLDIHRAIACQASLLLREGGHPMAAGFSIEPAKLRAFRTRLMNWLWEHAGPVEPPSLAIDVVLPWSEITVDLAEETARLAPFGAGNPRPVFASGPGTIVRIEDVSHRQETLHRRLIVDDGVGGLFRFVWFNARDLPQAGSQVDLAYHLSINTWRGRRRLQSEIVDWRIAAPFVDVTSVTLRSGRQIVDWRKEPDVKACLARLRQRFGDNLAIWAEGLESPPQDAVTRTEMPRSRSALAILAAPCSPAVLETIVREASPQLVYLLPPEHLREYSGKQILIQVAGMVRAELDRQDSTSCLERMAAQLGICKEAILAALRGLATAGKLTFLQGRELPGVSITASPLRPDPTAIESAAKALSYWIREMRSYRRAYLNASTAELFPDPE